MKKFCIITNSDKEAGMKAAEHIRQLLQGVGADCHILKNEPIGHSGQPRYTNEKYVPEGTECAFVLGGDGTMIKAANDFAVKFGKLNKQNQKYILGIEQAMLYAQGSEKTEKKQPKGKRGGRKDEF